MATLPARKTDGAPRRANGRRELDLLIQRDILDAVSRQRLRPGAKLTEEALAQIYGTSRTTVRRALVRLAHDKIVTLRPNRGAFVATPTVAEARDVFQARSMVETGMCRLAVKRLGQRDLTRLRDLAKRAHAAHLHGDPAGEVKLSAAFHRHIALGCGNAILAEILDELLNRSSLIVAMYQRSGGLDCAFDEHLEIADALAGGDGDRAAELMKRHLQAVEQRLELSLPVPTDVDLAQILRPAN